MRFVYFNLMPWTEGNETTEDWPVANKRYDPVRGTEVYREYIDNMAYAEECGFDFVGCNEHHMSPFGLQANPTIIAGAITQRTERVGLAVTGCLVPLLNPIRVAEEYAMLDVISGGRLLAGLLRGIPHEYVAYNVPPDESHGRLIEAVELIKKAWTEPEPFGWEGEFYQFRAVSIWPRPRQQPHPPIVMSGQSPSSARIAAEQRAILGQVLIHDVAAAREHIRIYKEHAHSLGWQPTSEHIMIGATCCVADTWDEAKRLMSEGRRYFAEVLSGGLRTAQRIVLQKTRYYEDGYGSKFRDIRQAVQQPIEKVIDDGLVLCGTPKMVVEQLKRLHREYGHGIMQISMKVGNIPLAAVTRGMTLFKEEILPEVRGL
jgi:alkanesulfonate monooxygenase SsuD/methylene tetrahydromethanopterin reductase-like flavin-dependent oxidoreductase (luciferase family)